MNQLKIKSRKILIIVTILFIFAAAIIIYGKSQSSAPPGMREVKSYEPNGICDALLPDCGFCPGEVIDGKCYINKNEFNYF